MSTDRKALALAYLDAVAKQQYDKVEALLAPDLHFKEPAMTRTSAQEFLGALKRLAAIHLRNDVKRIFVDGDDVCVIYDFVTDTTAGALPGDPLRGRRGRRGDQLHRRVLPARL